jgi:hypothetical protein
MERVALDHLRLESVTTEDVREALHDGAGARAGRTSDGNDGILGGHVRARRRVVRSQDVVVVLAARRQFALGRNSDRSLNSGDE